MVALSVFIDDLRGVQTEAGNALIKPEVGNRLKLLDKNRVGISGRAVWIPVEIRLAFVEEMEIKFASVF